MKKTYILITLLLAVVLTMLLSASAFAYDYGDVMTKAISWYDANRCGTGVATNNVFSSWRGNCHTSDSVNGGFHDAGDHVKFQLPAAFSASAIGWSIYEFKAAWPSAALTKAWQELKIFCDYSMACWNGSSMVIQIGDGGADHGYWGPPENQTGSRPTSTAAAADIVGQTAASLAIMSINYKSVDSAYATTCLNTAKAMFNAVKNSSTRGTAANGFYTSSSHADDLAWASIWLSIATGDQSYLANTDAWMDIKNDPGDPAYQKPWTYCWDDSALGNMIMMYKLTGGQKYYDGIMWNLNWYSTTLTKTPAGLPYLNQWAVLRYDSAEAGLMYIMAKEFGVGTYLTLANKMVDYALGSNPKSLCYVTNYTSNSVKHPHHRANEPNRDGVTKGMTGALAGGPDSGDGFVDDVNQYTYTEVALDYNASFLLGLAGRKYIADNLPTGTPPPTPTPYPTIAPGSGTGLVGNYYSGTALAGTPLLTRVDSTVNFNWAGGSPATNIPSDGFSARWTGQVEARSSQTYTFYLSHDDGGRMWVNNVQVINNWTDHAAVEDSGTIALTMGQKYSITVEFYESSGDASCQLSWSAGTTIPKQIIPMSQLYNTSVTPTPGRNTPTPTPTPTIVPNTPTPTRVNTPTPTRRGPTNTPTPTTRNTPTPTRGNTPTPTAPPPTSRGGYVVTYTISSDWGVGANADVIIKNNTASAVNGWTLAFTFPGNQKISNLWNGTYTQSGASVSVKDAGYNSTITANGGTVSFGFGMNYTGTNGKPTAFTLNGTACSVQ